MAEENLQNIDNAGLEIKNPESWSVPDGFDEGMFDENHALKIDAVKARFESDAATKASLEKQVVDLRRKVSNKDALASEEEYAKGYNNENFNKYITADNEKGKFLQATVGNIDKIAKENGLSLSQTNAIKDGLYALMKDLLVIDERTDEERISAIEGLQKEVLGDKAPEIVKSNVEWIKNYGLFSDPEKEMLELAAKEGNPLINSVLHKFHALFDKTSSQDIPVNEGINNDGLPSDSALAEEYVDPKTTQDRKIEIINMRIKAGRSGNLPISSKK